MERNSFSISPLPFALAIVGASFHSGIIANAATSGQIGPSKEQIGDLAHRIWEAEGRPEGREVEHWAEAEARLRALFGHIRMIRERTAW